MTTTSTIYVINFYCLCMRSLLLWWILWVVSFGFFTQMRSPSSPSETSSLAHRNERRIRQARIHANLAPYRSPPRLYVGLPLHDVGNAPSARPVVDLESHRAAHRGADREQQLALQDTPSRRRRRIPANRTDENRAPSPTPAVRRHIAQASNDGRNVNTRLRQLHKYPSLSSRTHPKTVAKRGNEGGVNVNDVSVRIANDVRRKTSNNCEWNESNTNKRDKAATMITSF
ncbi:hypothetical protein B0H11DRAFT_2308343 [Mycena galericulata]|nr:hypothetical protein B0H11DRAFT_2308343 [Mycena galericulata]